MHDCEFEWPLAGQACDLSTLEGRSLVPLYAARVEDLGPGDFVKVDCGVCDHTALLSSAFLFRLGLEPHDKILDLKGRVRCW
jgi:hypothetical protein